MAADNNVVLVGNCTRDPELRFTASGHADEVAPSLRYATAQVVRNERREGFDGGANSGGGGASRPAPNDPPAGYDMDEEPF